MASLFGRNILFCRSRQESTVFEQCFQEAGATVSFFPTFRIQFLSPDTEPGLVERLQGLQHCHWLIFSSVNGIKAFRHLIDRRLLTGDRFANHSIGIVGGKTARQFLSAFPQFAITARADHLQALLHTISSHSSGTTLKILHLTSKQSLKNIPLEVPENLEFRRLPLYQTAPNTPPSPEALRDLQAGIFEVIVFSSPTSFDYFLEIPGTGQLLDRAALAVLGGTTRNHIEKKGYPVHIMPAASDAPALVKAAADHFSIVGRKKTPRINETAKPHEEC